MPSTDEHLLQARHNETFSDSLDLDTTAFTDWIVTGYFYSALHLVDAYLATVNLHPHTHGERKQYALRYADLRAIAPEYRWLQERSLSARYDLVHFSAAEVRRDIQPAFAAVKAHILSLVA